MPIGLICKDGYVIGTDNKFVTPNNNPLYAYYRYYFLEHKRESPLNHKQVEAIIERLGRYEIGRVCDAMLEAAGG